MSRSKIAIALVSSALLAGAVGAARPGPAPGQEQEERPKFYAQRVVSEEGVKDAKAVLGEPDGRFAEIAVGGQMVLLMEKLIYPSTFDDGVVVCKGEASFGLAGWYLVSGTKDAPQFAWMPLVRGKSAGGFRLTSLEMGGGTPEGSPGVNLIRISNDDTGPILIDAVVAYGRPGNR